MRAVRDRMFVRYLGKRRVVCNINTILWGDKRREEIGTVGSFAGSREERNAGSKCPPVGFGHAQEEATPSSV